MSNRLLLWSGASERKALALPDVVKIGGEKEKTSWGWRLLRSCQHSSEDDSIGCHHLNVLLGCVNIFLQALNFYSVKMETF